MIKMLIDVDTGVDDSIALLYALNRPDVEIVGITTGCGNVDAHQAAVNTLQILELNGGGADIPVAIGADKPLAGQWDGVVALIHGDNGIGNVTLPLPQRQPVKEDAVELIHRMAEKYAGELVLVTLGRLTNIAIALEKYPELVHQVKSMVMMGGTLNMRGNVSPVAEANVAGDPEACDKVFMSGLDITVVGLDVTMKARLRREHVDMLERYCREECRPAAAYIRQALEYYFKGNRIQNHCLEDSPLHDPLAMMTAVVPSLVTVQKRKARVECGGTYCRGMIVTDLREYPVEANYVSFAVDVDADRAIGELLSVFY